MQRTINETVAFGPKEYDTKQSKVSGEHGCCLNSNVNIWVHLYRCVIATVDKDLFEECYKTFLHNIMFYQQLKKLSKCPFTFYVQRIPEQKLDN